jgi:hypothetical protein
MSTAPSCYVCKTNATAAGRCQKLYACSICKSRSYCSKECQKQDWTAGGHKQECSTLKMVRDGFSKGQDELEMGDPLPPDVIKHVNQAIRERKKTGFEFDCRCRKDKRYQDLQEHTEEILARDPSLRTKPITMHTTIVDFTSYRASADRMVMRTCTFLAKGTFLARLLSVQSRPQGEWAFCQQINRLLDEAIWKSRPWLCFQCQSPETRGTSMTAKFLFRKQVEEDMLMKIYRLPVCFECMPAATHQLPAINAKLWSNYEELK